MCHPHRHRQRHAEDDLGVHDAPVAVRRRDPDERVTDADRERAAALLSGAFRDGILRVEEFDQRLAAVYAATTAGELDAAMAELPDSWISDVQAAQESERRSSSHRRRWRAEAAVYAKVMLVLVAIWFVTNLGEFGTDEATHFWPIWPMLGWGIPLFLSRPRGPLARAVRHGRMARAR